MKKSTKYFLKSIIFVVAITAMANMAAGQTNQSICAGQSATLTATGGTSYNWSTGDTTATTVVTPANTTEYWVTVTQSGNTTVNSVTVTVNPLPIANILPAGNIINEGRDTVFYNVGSFVSLSATGGTNYLWSFGDTTPTISFRIPFSIYHDTTVTLTVTVSNAYGCSASDSVIVAVKSNCYQSVYNICQGQSAQLTAPQGSSNLLWSTGDSTATVIVSPDSANKYFVTVTWPDASTVVDSFMVNVKPNPIINIVADTISPAPGSPVTLTATGGVNMTYHWSKNTYGAVTTVFPVSTTIYGVQGRDMSGCTATAGVTITVNNNSTSAQSVYNICPGQTAQLTAPRGSSYLWSTGDSTATVIVSPDSANKYFVTVTQLDSTSVTDSFMVYIKPEPVVNAGPNITSPSPGSPVTLSASGGTNMRYYWNDGVVGNVISVSPNVTTMYIVTAYDGKSGCTATSKVTVNVNNKASTPQFVYKICTGQSVALTAPNVIDKTINNISYLWSTGDSTATVIVSPDSAKIYFVTVTLQDSTSVIDTFKVNIKPSPIVSAGPDITSPGVGAPITLTATGGIKYYWNNGIKGNAISVTPVVTTIYTVTAYAKNGCSAAANVTVTVNDINSSSIFIGQDSLGRSVISTIPDSTLYIQSARTASTDTARNTIINSNNAGRVGIGTNEPTEKLDVAGNAKINGDLIVKGNLNLDSSTVSLKKLNAQKISVSRIISNDSLIYFGDSTIVLDSYNEDIYNDGHGTFYKGIGLGKAARSSGLNAVSIGYISYANGASSIAIGNHVYTYGINSIVIGGGTNAAPLTNNIANSLMVGFNSDVPTLFVGPASGVGHIGNVGIGTATPKDLLQIGDNYNRVAIGTLGEGDLGWSTGYIGFNAVRNQANGNWEFASDNSPFNAGGVIMSNIGGSMIFVQVATGTTQPLTDAQLYSRRVMQIDPISYSGSSIISYGGIEVNGTVTAREVEVTTSGWWSDYVFDKDYSLMSINELEKYLIKNKHLPEVPSSSEVKEKGINVGDMDATLLKKIEELTLYVIEIKKENVVLQEKVKKLENAQNIK